MRRIMLMVMVAFLVGICLAGTPQRMAAAPDKFLTLPFPSHPSMQVVQGWTYTWDQYHGGIDYIKGADLDDASTWSKFDALAAAPGKACQDSFLATDRYGVVRTAYRVKVKHSNDYETRYVHLDQASIPSAIPSCSQPSATWKSVTRGERLGVASDTGAPPGWYHLHFELRSSTGTPVDPYDLRQKRGAYPDPNGTNGKSCGVNHFWTACPPVYSDAGNTASVTDIANPDAYSCSQPGFLDFEGLPDETNLSALSISGIRFTTTNGYTWITSDTTTGKYNGKYPSGAYMLKGTNAIWLGIMQGAGRIDFTSGPASYFSVLTSNFSQVYLDAYDAGNHLLATAGPAGYNLNTGHMAELKITRGTADIAYVMIHDTGNLWIADAICTNAPGVPGTISHLVDNTHQMQTGDHASGNFLLNLVAGVKHYLHIFVGPFFSDVDLVLTRPDGTIVSPGDPGVIYDKGSNYIEVGIDDAQAGEWHYEIIANQLEAGGEDIHITVNDELIGVANESPTLTVPGDQTVQYSDPLTFGISASDPDAGDVLTLSASGLPANLTFVDNGDGTGAVSGTAQVAAGSYPVTFSVSDGVNAPVSAGLNIVVGKEDATLAYSGDSLVKKGLPVMLKASVSELPDGSPGDISQAAVFFDVTAGIGGGTTTYGPVPVSASGEATLTLPTGLPANVYSVDVRMDPATTYYQAPSADTAALVVYDPSAGFTVGGGWVMDGGAKGNFGFVVKYLKSGTIQGQALYVYRSGDVVTRVKSNAMRWLVISGNTAVFRGKATVNGVGNHTFEITVVDNGQPGSSDTFAIKIWRPDGTLLHEVPPTTLGGGNVIVPQPKGR